jgi:hypothetical protein
MYELYPPLASFLMYKKLRSRSYDYYMAALYFFKYSFGLKCLSSVFRLKLQCHILSAFQMFAN